MAKTKDNSSNSEKKGSGGNRKSSEKKEVAGSSSKVSRSLLQQTGSNKQKKFKCLRVMCQKAYSSRSARAVHMRKCEKPSVSPKKRAKKEGETFKCRFCSKSFKVRSSVYRHQKDGCEAAQLFNGQSPIKTKKEKQREFKCLQCDHVCDRKAKLECHVSSKHTDMNKHYCGKCGKTFKRIDFFRKHQSQCSELSFISMTLENRPSISWQSSEQEVPSLDNINLSNTEEDDSNTMFFSPPIEIPSYENVVDDIVYVIPSDWNHDADNHGCLGNEGDEIDNNDETSTAEDCVDDEDANAVIDDDVAYDDFVHLLSSGLIKHLAEKKKDNEYLFSILYNILGDNIHNEKIQTWVYKSLGIRKKRFTDRLNAWFGPVKTKKGRPFLEAHMQQKLFDLWLSCSTLSVDRRDGRDHVTMSMKTYRKRYGKIECTLVTTATKRKIEVAKAPRYVSCITVRKLVQKFEKLYGCRLSMGTVSNYRPFFVVVANEREKLECLCKVCLNTRLLFDTVMTSAKQNHLQTFDSITKYFVNNDTCHVARNEYIHHDCITGLCGDCGGLLNPHAYALNDVDVSYYQFELVPTGKVNKKGKPSKRTARKDYNESIVACKTKLDGMGKKYLLHRYNVVNDKFVWPQILERCLQMGERVCHIDYSENIQEKPKFQVQDAHFNQASHTLHCSVIHQLPENVYANHFSDVSKSWQFTAAVILDLISNYLSQLPIVRIKSDNCPMQYKSLHVFGFYMYLARTLSKVFLIYYGSSGHGRGLVDGMSSFCVKEPLRSEIVNNDFFWSLAADLVKFFQHKEMKENYVYKELTQSMIDAVPNCESLVLKGIRKQHMIAFHPNGEIERVGDICECDECLVGNLSKCLYADGKCQKADGIETTGDDADSDDDYDDDDNDDEHVKISDAICIGSVIALRTPINAKESFYLCAVNEISVATGMLHDTHGHIVLEGNEYLSCNYLAIESEKSRNFIKYKKLTAAVYVLPEQVLCPFVNIGDDYRLTLDEKQFLDDCA